MSLRLLTTLLGLWLFAVPAFAKVVLLTSLDPELNRPPLRTKNWNINKKLQEIFLDKIETNEEIEIIHLADQASLYEKLNDPTVSALFWVSHSSNTKDSTDTALSTASVLDYQFRDVLPLFQKIPSHIKYLAMVGCRSELIINELKKRNLFDVTIETQLFLEEKKVDARKSLKRAIGEFNEAKLKNSAPVCKVQDAIEIRYKRTAGESDLDSVRIMVGKSLLTVLPKLKAGLTQEGSLFVTSEVETKNDLKILVDSGASSQAKVSIGTLEFEADFDGTWKLFAKPDGTPFGIGSHVYQLKTKTELREITRSQIEMCN